MSLSSDVIKYIEDRQEETLKLLMDVAKTPAPSGHEEKRAAFCLQWLRSNGVENAYTDDINNVIIPFGDCGTGSSVTAFLAHGDVVFPDMEELPQHVDGNFIYGPGIGDNSTHVTHVLMAARYITEKKLTPKQGGVLLVINSGEEGLGNLRGCRRIVETFGDRITEFYSLDSKDGKIHCEPVGSKRYRVEICTEGGHSYNEFGSRNAIEYLASLIETLYTMQVPAGGKTTYNVGMISGGTSVNSIAQQAEMLYEFRSDRREALESMDRHFLAAIDLYRAKGVTVNVELMGERPCMGAVDEAKHKAIVDKAAETVTRYFDLPIRRMPGSTDCNIPLSVGIPAVNTGCYIGYGTHTREEHIELSSLCPSQKVAFDLILDCFVH